MKFTPISEALTDRLAASEQTAEMSNLAKLVIVDTETHVMHFSILAVEQKH